MNIMTNVNKIKTINTSKINSLKFNKLCSIEMRLPSIGIVSEISPNELFGVVESKTSGVISKSKFKSFEENEVAQGFNSDLYCLSEILLYW